MVYKENGRKWESKEIERTSGPPELQENVEGTKLFRSTKLSMIIVSTCENPFVFTEHLQAQDCIEQCKRVKSLS